MPGEDQERFEDYLELERFIAELQAGHAAYPPQELTPTQARVYRMAMLFHAATPGVGEPDAEFSTRLQERLEQELQTPQEAPASTAAAETLPVTPISTIVHKRKPRVPRRLLLAGSVSAAASMVVGAGVEHMAEMAMHRRQQATLSTNGSEVVIKLVTLMDWFPVTTVAEVGHQAVKFRAEDQSGSLGLTGYVVFSDGTNGDPGEKGQIIAMSAACTHKGCIVEWDSSDRKFHCPCHGGIFSEDGGVSRGSSTLYLNPLPRLDVKIDNGQIYVRMPES